MNLRTLVTHSESLNAAPKAQNRPGYVKALGFLGKTRSCSADSVDLGGIGAGSSVCRLVHRSKLALVGSQEALLSPSSPAFDLIAVSQPELVLERGQKPEQLAFVLLRMIRRQPLVDRFLEGSNRLSERLVSPEKDVADCGARILAKGFHAYFSVEIVFEKVA
jgi:hypothetical protein